MNASSMPYPPHFYNRPLTKRFKLRAPKHMSSPWSLLLAPEQTVAYTVEFNPPVKVTASAMHIFVLLQDAPSHP